MRKLLLWISALCPLSLLADTIYVEKARMAGPFVVRKPYATDSTNMKRKAFDITEVLKNNASQAFLQGPATAEVVRGEALTTAQGEATLRVLHFPLTASRFVKAKVNVKGLSSYKLYADEAEVQGGNLTLSPGRTQVAIVCLTQPEKKDSFHISIEGENLAGLSLATGGKRPYTMADMMLGDHYRNVALSPSGKYLVTVYYETKRDGGNLFRTVLTETATGRELMRWAEYMSLSWMPREDMLYYTRRGAEGRQLVTFDPQTLRETVVAEGLPEGGFTLSPSMDYLIVSKTDEGEKETNGLRRIMEPDDRQPGWRNRNALYRFDLRTKVMQRLTFGERSVWLNDISADGRTLLLSYSRMDTRRLPFSRTTLLTMDAYTGRVDTLLADTAFIGSCGFSPDAKSVLVQASPGAFDRIGCDLEADVIPNGFDYRLYLLDLATRKVRPLLPDFAPSVDKFSWLPGDGNIYFLATDGCDRTLFRLEPGSGKTTRFSFPVSYLQGYGIGSMQKHPRVVVYGQTGERAREMFTAVLNSARPKATRIGEIDFDRMYRDVAIGSCHDWSFRSSRGDSIRGFYFLPPDFDATKRYPLIVYYYGGCTPTGKTLEFQYPLQVLAGQGYVVYVCEPSGAIGYGQEFAARHVNTWGNESGDDIIEGTKAFLAAHPFVNPKKVGCMGASYGGFMTQYLQTRTDLFAAAVSHAGISNIASYWGGGYWGYTYGEAAQFGSFPWNNPDLYVKQSPLFNADKIHTPLLLLHGTVDTNVPTNESLQMFTALRILGRPVSLVEVDGENHVIVNHNKRLAWQNAIFAWLAYWLKDEPEWWRELYPADNFGNN